jgi:hypothetical protein
MLNQYLSNHFDVHYVKWIIWLFTPILVAFLLPLLIVLLFYVSALIVHLYRHRYRLTLVKESYAKGEYWNSARQAVAIMWDAHGWIYHGYEIKGLENIPNSGPGLIVYYHGAIPVDYYYLCAKCILQKNRLIKAVGDKFLFNMPGWKLLMEVFQIFPGTVQTCSAVLERGDLLSISPGGVREAQFGGNNYQLLWGDRIGFAKVAIAAKAPIIPVFTVNLREAFRTLSIGQSWFRKIYNKTRLPVAPVYGGFPVKLITIIGKPIEFDPNRDAQELASLTAQAIENLVNENQRLPGSILRALIERVYRKN